jgi:hypothetical protein
VQILGGDPHVGPDGLDLVARVMSKRCRSCLGRAMFAHTVQEPEGVGNA